MLLYVCTAVVLRERGMHRGMNRGICTIKRERYRYTYAAACVEPRRCVRCAARQCAVQVYRQRSVHTTMVLCWTAVDVFAQPDVLLFLHIEICFVELCPVEMCPDTWATVKREYTLYIFGHNRVPDATSTRCSRDLQ